MDKTNTKSIGALVREMETNYLNGTTQKSKHVSESLYDDVNKIEAYLNSRHTSGSVDSLGRDKPFFNICVAARNIWFRATDLDRKHLLNIQDKNALLALIAKIYLQAWMDKVNFGQFLNNWGLNSAGYNESVVKFVEQGGELIANVVPWTRIICDPIDFTNNPKLEILELTPGQLRQREGYDQDVVKELLDDLTVRKNPNGQNKDTKADYIRLYEVHGLFPKSYLTGNEEDDEEYVQQMHVITFTTTKRKGDVKDYTLFSGREEKDPYMLTALLPEVDGSIGLNGAVKNLFDAQWMQNHSVKLVKDHLDLASKLIFQTSDGNFTGQNALTSIETGDILINAINQPITQINNSSHDITQIQNFQNQWKVLSNEINGISEAMLGQNPPSGSAWRQTQALLNESHSLFETMTENKGLAIEQMLRVHILPYIKKKLKNTKELVAVLEAHDIKTIDGRYIKNQATKAVNKAIKDVVLSGGIVTPEAQMMATQMAEQKLRGGLEEMGAVRAFKPSEVDDKTWADLFKDMEWGVRVNITGEAQNDENMLSTLTTMLQVLGTPQGLDALKNNPTFALLVNKILSTTGQVNPVELEQTIQATKTLPSPATQGGVVGGEIMGNINPQTEEQDVTQR